MNEIFRLSRVLAVLLAIGGLGCDSDDDQKASSKNYVLVHGAWMGAWCWDEVAAGLRQQGATVVPVELPAHGADTTGIEGATLDAYIAKVRAALENTASPSILVGHSMGGMVITGAAELAPAKVAKLVYVGAYLPKDGQSLFELAMTDADSQLGKVLNADQQRGIATLPKDKLGDLFLADGSAAAVARLQMNYRDEPLLPFVTPVRTTAANWGALPKVYVYTKQDRALSHTLQQAMTAGIAFSSTVTLDTGHSPFLSQPAMLVAALSAL
jgi:pimeloyl-ACP methyl ester carboxylesterase